MARQEADREDLLRDAVAFPNRAQFNVPGIAEEIFVGLRTSGAASIYIGADPVYHFNSQGELRRAYVDGLLYKAERGDLIAMERIRTATEVTLESRALDQKERAAFLQEMQSKLTQIKGSLQRHEYRLMGEVSDAVAHAVENSAMARIQEWSDSVPAKIAIAKSPRA